MNQWVLLLKVIFRNVEIKQKLGCIKFNPIFQNNKEKSRKEFKDILK